MKRYKKKYNIYSAWNYGQEVLDLNAQSEKGWQLVKGKSFSHKYEYNPQVCYRYQLDYLPGISGTSEMVRCLDTYKEQGWEFVNKTFNGWYYFRKVYDSTLPEEEYELYTDRSSLKEMQGRWAKLAILSCVLVGLCLIQWGIQFIQQPCLPCFIMSLVFGIEFILLLRGAILMRNPNKPKAHKADCFFTLLFFVVMIGGVTGSLCLLFNRSDTGPCYFGAAYFDTIPADIENATHVNSLSVTYSDRYYLDLNISAEAPICFSILNDTGEPIYTVTDSDIAIDDFKLHLDKGEYKIYLSDFDGGQLDVNYRLR